MCKLLLLGTVVFVCTSMSAMAANTVKGITGYDTFISQYGWQQVRGEGVRVAQVEAPEDVDDAFKPNPGDSAFVGKVFNVIPYSVNPPLVSGHATQVAKFFYGKFDSLAPKAADIDVYNVNSWAFEEFLGTETAVLPRTNAPPTVAQPDPPPARVTVHAWATGSPDPLDVEILERIDYVVDHDNAIQVVGARNTAGSPNLLPTDAYNVITVGLLNGNHGNSTVTLGPYIGGRQAPLLVVPAGSTSDAVPFVGGAAVLLVQRAHDNPSLSHNQMDGDVYFGETAVVVKAALMAGARRDLVKNNGDPDGIYNSTRNYLVNSNNNLDTLYGAGLLNVLRSFQIIDAGQQNAFEDGGPSLVQNVGWDFNDHFGGSVDEAVATYHLSLEHWADFTATLTWNAQIDPDKLLAGDFNNAMSLRNLNLKFFKVGDVNPLQASLSTLQNTENIYLLNLAPGDYYLEVSKLGADFDIEYGLAWYSTPEPASAVAMVMGSMLVAARRPRRI